MIHVLFKRVLVNVTFKDQLAKELFKKVASKG